jgi:hypothetical protein
MKLYNKTVSGLDGVNAATGIRAYIMTSSTDNLLQCPLTSNHQREKRFFFSCNVCHSLSKTEFSATTEIGQHVSSNQTVTANTQVVALRGMKVGFCILMLQN